MYVCNVRTVAGDQIHPFYRFSSADSSTTPALLHTPPTTTQSTVYLGSTWYRLYITDLSFYCCSSRKNNRWLGVALAYLRRARGRSRHVSTVVVDHAAPNISDCAHVDGGRPTDDGSCMVCRVYVHRQGLVSFSTYSDRCGSRWRGGGLL